MNIKSQTTKPIRSCSFHFGAKTALFGQCLVQKTPTRSFFPPRAVHIPFLREILLALNIEFFFSPVLPTVIGTTAAFLRTTQLLNRADQPWAGQTDRQEGRKNPTFGSDFPFHLSLATLPSKEPYFV